MALQHTKVRPQPNWLLLLLLHSHNHIQLNTYICGNKINKNDKRTHFFRKIYLSLYSKGLRKGCERVMSQRWVGDWTDCNILTPNSFVFSSTSFSFCWAAQSGVLRAHSPLLGAGSLYSILYPTNWLQLTEFRVAPGYIIVCRPPASCERRICTQFNSQGYTLISSTGCICSLIDGWVDGKYVTLWY